jgi:FixJ family two-component response regulator
MNEATLVHVVDDDDAVRESLGRLLRSHGMNVRLYRSAGEFLLASPIRAPGCVLLDLRMPGPGGLELQASLARQEDAPAVVFMSGEGDIRSSVLAIRRGAIDFLTKPIDADALLAAIRSAIDFDASRRAERQRAQELRRRFAQLTPRERAVFDQVVSGKLNKQIAGSLQTCVRTVKSDRAHVMQAFRVHTLADLVRVSVELGEPPRPGLTVPA